LHQIGFKSNHSVQLMRLYARNHLEKHRVYDELPHDATTHALGAALAIARLSFCHGDNPTARRDT